MLGPPDCSLHSVSTITMARTHLSSSMEHRGRRVRQLCRTRAASGKFSASIRQARRDNAGMGYEDEHLVTGLN
ncbi:hypothetical protein CDV36_016476 [Fusarium kuroshium]|uniref:Uncharacterized protein n=1 Tax=Fusarium kuroshium TaxID=2010991 RepID=A0A3M2QNM2_9HYPO|nr:hypothetical protein CDV36_016476 [Fusarium kuroshium]